MTSPISANAISKPITSKLSRGACIGIGGIGGVSGSANIGGGVGVGDLAGGAEGVPGATYGIGGCP